MRCTPAAFKSSSQRHFRPLKCYVQPRPGTAQKPEVTRWTLMTNSERKMISQKGHCIERSVLQRKKILCFWKHLVRTQKFKGKRKGEAIQQGQGGGSLAQTKQKKVINGLMVRSLNFSVI